MEGAKKPKSIKQIGNAVQATQTLPPWCLHSWILLHYASDWSICHREKGNCNGTRRRKTWIMDGYYWELKGENSSITRQEAIEIVHFPWIQGCSPLAVLCPEFAAKPSLCRTYELCTEDLIYVQLMLWFQCSCIIAGTQRWFINSEHCVFPRHERKTKKTARTANFFLEFWKGIKHAHYDPNHNQLQETRECPCIMKPGSLLLDHFLGNTQPKLFPNGWNPCCCAYRLPLHQ